MKNDSMDLLDKKWDSIIRMMTVWTKEILNCIKHIRGLHLEEKRFARIRKYYR